MAHEAHIHPAQTQILQELLFVPSETYSRLMKQTGLTSDHFSFHLKKLVELGYIQKTTNKQYALTPKGKEHANKLDTDRGVIERQPKVAVLLNLLRETDDGWQLLIQQRLKQPFYGFWCLPSGKIRWGETIIETAQRELMEETGLTCDNPRLYGVQHKIDMHESTGELLEDKIFFEVLCLNPSGDLQEQFTGGLNRWVYQHEIKTIGKYFSGIEQPFKKRLHKNFKTVEKYYYYKSDEY
jgi:8-oxo-dGTP pyrophosphatase MutT (NUDIX family)